MGRASHSDSDKRRSGGALRVPFIRRCNLDFEGAEAASGFIVSINTLGAYVALDHMPHIGRRVVSRFNVPGSEREVVAEGVVAWLNPVQEHPVHSLPPGFGLAFRRLDQHARKRIERIVLDYLDQHGNDD